MFSGVLVLCMCCRWLVLLKAVKWFSVNRTNLTPTLSCSWSSPDVASVLSLHSWATSKAIQWDEEPSRLRLYTSSRTDRFLSESQEAPRDAASLLHPSLSTSQEKHPPSQCLSSTSSSSSSTSPASLASLLKRHCCVTTSAPESLGDAPCEDSWECMWF